MSVGTAGAERGAFEDSAGSFLPPWQWDREGEENTPHNLPPPCAQIHIWTPLGKHARTVARGGGRCGQFLRRWGQRGVLSSAPGRRFIWGREIKARRRGWKYKGGSGRKMDEAKEMAARWLGSVSHRSHQAALHFPTRDPANSPNVTKKVAVFMSI